MTIFNSYVCLPDGNQIDFPVLVGKFTTNGKWYSTYPPPSSMISAPRWALRWRGGASALNAPWPGSVKKKLAIFRWFLYVDLWKMAHLVRWFTELQNGWIFYSYVKLPEGIFLVDGWATPLKNDGVRQLGVILPNTLWKNNPNVPNRQPVVCFLSLLDGFCEMFMMVYWWFFRVFMISNGDLYVFQMTLLGFDWFLKDWCLDDLDWCLDETMVSLSEKP